MKKQRMIRMNDQRVVADPCLVTEHFSERLWGLMGRSGLEKNTGLLIKPCNSIHTFFMKFKIDVLYLDESQKIVKIRRNMSPWRIDFPVFKAKAVLELPGGAANDLGQGDQLCLS